MGYPVVIEFSEGQGHSAWVPDLPGCGSQGATREEALANVREALEGWIETAKEKGWVVPEPYSTVALVKV